MEDKFKPKCINHNLEFVLYIIKNGSKRLIKQCLCCGEKQMQNYKLNSVKNINSIPLYSLDLWNKYKDNQSFSKSLYYEAKNERFEDYRNYINSNKWHLLRKEVIKEYDGKCFFCWEKGTDVHHKTYDNFGNEPLTDLVLLCRKCHDEEHTHNPNLRYVNKC